MKMTLEQHREFGELAKQFRERLLEPHVFCVGRASSPESRAVKSAIRYVDRLRNKLDNVVCRDFPNCPDVTRIYYGTSKSFLAEQEHAKGGAL